jgi:hypothetical protein
MFPQKRPNWGNQTEKRERKSNIGELFAQFQTDEGDLDTDKIMDAVYHLNKIYYDIEPLLKNFKKN